MSTQFQTPPTQNLRLEQYRDLCRRAHQGTSFSPEKRADYYVKAYSEMLESDLSLLPEDQREYYESKFKSLFSAWMHRKSNCISWMITGPSKFPTRRADKANRGEENAYKIFDEWRERFLSRRDRKAKLTLDGELEKAINDLATAERNQITMKRVNALCRKKNAAELLAADGWNEKLIHEFLNPPYSYMGKGFQSYALTNNNANIKRLRDRVEMLTDKVTRRDAGEHEVITKDWGRVEVNRAEDRVQFFFNEKPSREVINTFKSGGWNWSPNAGAWQRKITPNALYAAKMIVKELG